MLIIQLGVEDNLELFRDHIIKYLCMNFLNNFKKFLFLFLICLIYFLLYYSEFDLYLYFLILLKTKYLIIILKF